MTNEDRDEINAILAAHRQRLVDDLMDELMEQSARLSVVRFLLEDLYADAYTRRLPDFEQRMADLMELTRTAMTRGHAMTDDEAIEMQARHATHLERFRNAVRPRIESRSKRT